ncbi:GerAB/ArcD/ProY family transporter [Paraliobacillus salinarum]|uniref:GerAB/ArcD/ProY family transporter n=1 Tax=Paraliobacillus salinarum TaxID=1158996 RepID=UPI0015F4D481|nr:endospore germination permease [Paraliobacillus salinarum]
MNKLELSYEAIHDRDILIAIPSMAIAIGILYMPRKLAQPTIGLDAVLSILLGGIIIILFTWLTVRLASKFPGQSFITYASKLASKPVAIGITLLFVLHGIFITSFEIRAISNISHLYLFDKTPIEIISFVFLLAVVYAVSGSRAAIFRLNALFLPFIIVAIIALALLSFRFTEINNALPVFQTNLDGYFVTTYRSMLTISGFGVLGYLLFYVPLIKSPTQTSKASIIGVLWVIASHLIVLIITILVFGNIATSNLIFPVIELARDIELPGEFFNRFDSLFFAIWIMAIFNTSAMSFDVAVLALQSLFKKVTKLKIVFILSPIIYFISSLPKNSYETGLSGRVIGYLGLGLSIGVTLLLFLLRMIRGVK